MIAQKLPLAWAGKFSALAPRPKPAFNRHRLYCLPLYGPLEDVRNLLRRCCNKLLIAQQMQRIVFASGFWVEFAAQQTDNQVGGLLPELDMLLLDRVLPYEGKNVILTKGEYNTLLAFAGQLARWQGQTNEPLLGGYTKVQIGQMLSDLFRQEVTYIRFQL